MGKLFSKMSKKRSSSLSTLLFDNSDEAYIVSFKVFAYLTIAERCVLSTVNSNSNKQYAEQINFELQELKAAAVDERAYEQSIDKVVHSYPTYFIHMLGGIANILKIATLDLNNMMGSTGYLDFTLSDTVANNFNANVVRGYDCWNRAFVLVKAILPFDPGTPGISNISLRGRIADNVTPYNPSRQCIVTAFQRYPDTQLWQVGSISIGSNDQYSHFKNFEIMGDGYAPENSYFYTNGFSGAGRRGLKWLSKLITEGSAGLPVFVSDSISSSSLESKDSNQRIELYKNPAVYAFFAASACYQKCGDDTFLITHELFDMITEFTIGTAATRDLLHKKELRTNPGRGYADPISPVTTIVSHCSYFNRLSTEAKHEDEAQPLVVGMS